MVNELLYPCGIDLVGVSLREIDIRISEAVPYVISATFMLPKDKILEIVIEPKILCRPDVIHATGPCELVSVKHRNIEYVNEVLHAHSLTCRWVYVHRACDRHEIVVCKIRCLPQLFMLQDVEPTSEDTVRVSGPKNFLSEEEG